MATLTVDQQKYQQSSARLYQEKFDRALEP
jgi:hypothetical protein